MYVHELRWDIVAGDTAACAERAGRPGPSPFSISWSIRANILKIFSCAEALQAFKSVYTLSDCLSLPRVARALSEGHDWSPRALLSFWLLKSALQHMAQAPRAQMPEDLGRQLSALLGRHGPHKIRKTEGDPLRISVIDVAVLITGHGSDYASQAIRNVCHEFLDVREKITDFKFPGRGQKNTPVSDARGIVAIGRINTQRMAVFCLRVMLTKDFLRFVKKSRT